MYSFVDLLCRLTLLTHTTTITMSLTQSISSTYIHSILLSAPIKPKDILPRDVSLFDLEPEALVDMALHKLQTTGTRIIEWRSLLYKRMHVPVIITVSLQDVIQIRETYLADSFQHFSYIVPDDKLEAASNMLADMGLPRSSPPELLLNTGGDFYAKGRLHRLTRSEMVGPVQYLILYPLSFSSFSLSELTPAPRLTSLASPRCHTVLVPRPSAVYASILRMMLRYKQYCPTRSVLKSDLSELIGYNLYDLQGGYVDVDDEELCEQLQVDRRIDDAVQYVKEWGWNGEWREGEEWMGDVLCAVVRGPGDIEYLPWAP
jgi:hypothetical protein